LISSFVSLVSLFQPKADPSVEFLTTKSPLITFDFELRPNHLSYSFWDVNGPQQVAFPISKPFENLPKLHIINNQIFMADQQLTFDHSNKLQPQWLNKNEILFLSDKERGIGFYQIRTLHIEQ
jgi:hypothetical protein